MTTYTTNPSYAPDRKPTNVEGQDTFTVRLPRNRKAWLTLPKEFDASDVERITQWLALIAESSEDHRRNPGPPEPNGRNP
ncbi:hypothetical protein [Paraburkholderia graminis]|uniref:hypothetical protein n=1 Tax=Paraburkholderia graminis TaxID=60548 RepID=UPI0038BE100C